jgi:hypothetical protein
MRENPDFLLAGRQNFGEDDTRWMTMLRPVFFF